MSNLLAPMELLPLPENISIASLPKSDLTTLYDVNISGLSNGDTLRYNSVTGKWAPYVPAGSGTVTQITAGMGLSGGIITSIGTISLNATLGMLNDVNIPNLINDREVLTYDALLNKWTPDIVHQATESNGLRTLTTSVNVSNATAPTTGQILTATGPTSATWQTPPFSKLAYIDTGAGLTGGHITTGGTISLNANLGILNDVSLSAVKHNDVLTYDAVHGIWVAKNDPIIAGLLSTSTGTITINTTTPSAGQVLTAAGPTTATWQNIPQPTIPTVSTATNALNTVTGAYVNVSNAAAPTVGQILTATGATAATWQTIPINTSLPNLNIGTVPTTLALLHIENNGGQLGIRINNIDKYDYSVIRFGESSSTYGNAAIHRFNSFYPSAIGHYRQNALTFWNSTGAIIFYAQKEGIEFYMDSFNGTPTLSAVVDTTGIYPGAANVQTIGNSTVPWAGVYARDGTITTSDRTQKDLITPCTLGLDFINHLKPVSYKWRDYKYLDKISKNNTTNTVIRENKYTRKHYGLISQDVLETLKHFGISSADFGGFILDKGEDPMTKEPIDRYGLRYMEFIAPLIRAVQELHAEVQELRAKLANIA